MVECSVLVVICIIGSARALVSGPRSHGCSYESLPQHDSSKQITCADVDSFFFQNSVLNLQRARWLTCRNCNLTDIVPEVFAFGRNTIDFLVLSRNHVKTVSPFSFSRLTNLKVLNLKSNFLSSLEPDTFSGIPRLLQLDLSSNLLGGLSGHGLFRHLRNLDILNLNRNNISTVEPDAFRGLQNLKYLYLSDNSLTHLDDGTFLHLKSLHILYLERNRISYFDPSAFRDLSDLHYLYLNNNTVSRLVQYNFKHLNNLTELQLRHNNLSDVPNSSFNGLRNLKFLYLGDNQIVHVQRYGMVGLDSLRVLELTRNSFRHFDLEFLRGCEGHLSALWLDDNPVINLTVGDETRTHDALQVISLVRNRLGTFDYENLLAKTPVLQELWIGDNEWSCDFILELCAFCAERNVSVCASTDCNFNSVKKYIETICFEPFQNETDLSGDFPTSRTNRRIYSEVLLVFLMFVKFL